MLTRDERCAAAGLVGAAVLLAGCGLAPGSDGASDGAADEATTTAREPATVALASGTLDPDALSDFSCAAGDDGRWEATGTITNTSGRLARYVVIVVVAGSEGVAGTGLRRWVATLDPGDSTTVHLRRLPAAGRTDVTCQAQVLRRS